MLRDKNKVDALDYFLRKLGFNVTTVNIQGPFAFLFDPQLDENWRILYQALALCIVLILVLVLDKHGAFVHLRSQRLDSPSLIVAIAESDMEVSGGYENANRLCTLAHKRGLTPDGAVDGDKTGRANTATEDTDIDTSVPARGEKILLYTAVGVFGGVVLENDGAKVSEKLKREWIARWEKKRCRILHLKLGDSVAVTVPERVAIYGWILSYRFPRFIRKAFKRRTKIKATPTTYLTVSSHARNRVLGIVPVANEAFAKDITRFLPKASEKGESKKTI